VLVVDDEPQMLVAFEDLLADTFEVQTTDQPQRALRIAEEDQGLAVVISDQRMPGMTGDQLLTRLRERSAATRMLCTGYADLDAVTRSVNEGKIYAYVTKPWQRDDLRLKVQHAADHFRLHHELAYEKQLFADLMRSTPDAIFFKDVQGRYIRVNPAFVALLGVTEADVLGKRIGELSIDRAIADVVQAIVFWVMRVGKPHRGVVHFRAPDGASLSASTTRAAVQSPDGSVLGLVGISRNITEMMRTEQALRASEERLRLAFLASDSGLFDWNLETGEALYSPTSAFENSGTTAIHDFAALEQRVHPDDTARLRDALNAHLVDREPLRGLQLRVKDGEGQYRWLELSAQAAWNANGKAVRLVGATLDVTERKDLDSRVLHLDHLTRHDELTDLRNRAQFSIELGNAIAAAQASGDELVVVALNVVRFRHINESLGRPAGDQLLREVAARLGEAAGNHAVLARFQADTFVVMLRAEAGFSASAWLESVLLPALAPNVEIEGVDVAFSTKAGLAVYPSDAADADALVAHAETALKQAKRSAHSYLAYTPSMNSQVGARLRLETKLRRALANDEFLLYYQPKIELKTGEVVGLEALIRWRDPEVGLVPPGSFIPLLEETELILPVGRWVLLEAARQFCAWRAQGSAVPRIAVNVSALQLVQRDFVAVLDATLERHPEAASGLDLELTESVLMDDLSGNIDKLRAAQERGLKVAIDDFGTGYSSLGYLSRLPLDALKVDRSFIERMAEDPQQMSIVTAVISLAHSLDLKVIAEGVETPAQAQLLRLLRCDQIQGYLMARPQPAEVVNTLFGKKLEVPRVTS
jgi:diguanylate cyclase (GGDEF)-like protein/PAS domain S-box-containing protein